MKSSLSTKIGLLLLVLATPVLAQTDLSKPIPFDPNVKKGQLSNGLTYYIRKNVEPKDRAELRLVVKAGSVLETDEQQRSRALHGAHELQWHQEFSQE